MMSIEINNENFITLTFIILIIIILILGSKAVLIVLLIVAGIIMYYKQTEARDKDKDESKDKLAEAPKFVQVPSLHHQKDHQSYPGAIDEDNIIPFSQCADRDDIAMHDADSLNTYHVRSRNDPERVWYGISQRHKLIDKHVTEELDMTEDREWWGRHDL